MVGQVTGGDGAYRGCARFGPWGAAGVKGEEDRGREAGAEAIPDSRQSTDNHSTTAHNLVATDPKTIPAKQLGHAGEGPAQVAGSATGERSPTE